MRIAIIDCGTNTFNLLIAEKNDHQLDFIYEDKIPVKIGKGGIENRTIVPEAYQRAMDAMKSYALAIKKHQVDKVIATSTSAFRSTDNGPQLRDEIFKATGIHIDIISGDEEASYIYKGATWAYPPAPGETYLIMDIGGGSTEFILYNSEKILFSKSYLLGASRILEKFKPADPLSSKDIQALYDHFEAQLKDELIATCHINPPSVLVGTSGFFDTLRRICFYEFNWKNEEQLIQKNCTIPLHAFNHWYTKMLPMNLQERMNIEGMTNFRAEMMGASMLLVNYVIAQSGVKSILNTTYALKEGVLLKAIEQ